MFLALVTLGVRSLSDMYCMDRTDVFHAKKVLNALTACVSLLFVMAVCSIRNPTALHAPQYKVFYAETTYISSFGTRSFGASDRNRS
jgi:hypothetical protein